MIEKHFNDTNEFIDFIRLSNRTWQSDNLWTSNWIFRGHKDSEWALLPSLLREPYIPILKRLIDVNKEIATKAVDSQYESEFDLKSQVRPEHRERVIFLTAFALAEQTLLNLFTEGADQIGLQLPINSLTISVNSILSKLKMKQSFSIGGGTGIRTLAQHHGIPTRLLDWTRNPLKSLFFAASEVDPLTTEGKNIALWAIDPSRFKQCIENRELEGCKKFHLLEVPKNTNKFLHAQEGLFTSMIGSGDLNYLLHGSWPQISEYMEMIQSAYDHPNMYKLTISQNKAGEILKQLSIEGIKYSTLMPTLDNVTKSIYNRLKWELK